MMIADVVYDADDCDIFEGVVAAAVAIIVDIFMGITH